MKIIIGPTKKQNSHSNRTIKTEPQFQKQSEELRVLMKSFSKEKLQAIFKISDKLTDEVYHYYHSDFDLVPALDLYNGAVFKSANIDEWNKDDYNYAQEHLIILSALYGPLRPLDGIKPYRLDFLTKLEMNLYEYWEAQMAAFNNHLDYPIINLASNEFSKMVPSQNLVNVKFIEENGKVKSAYAKKARGKMVSYIITNQIDSLDDLKSFNEMDYRYDDHQSTSKELVFTR